MPHDGDVMLAPVGEAAPVGLDGKHAPFVDHRHVILAINNHQSAISRFMQRRIELLILSLDRLTMVPLEYVRQLLTNQAKAFH